jgi:hypothetical protein
VPDVPRTIFRRFSREELSESDLFEFHRLNMERIKNEYQETIDSLGVCP